MVAQKTWVMSQKPSKYQKKTEQGRELPSKLTEFLKKSKRRNKKVDSLDSPAQWWEKVIIVPRKEGRTRSKIATKPRVSIWVVLTFCLFALLTRTSRALGNLYVLETVASADHGNDLDITRDISYAWYFIRNWPLLSFKNSSSISVCIFSSSIHVSVGVFWHMVKTNEDVRRHTDQILDACRRNCY